ncbi:uncharacterized protein LOC143373909 isoform X2 [Andrena cerasifolii]|uniref:uncharacterized protein LOC143373909 isoform X2 n=1 Tax=Andrena cerasifolii TaxID=2819439 RepID=UPI0040376D50
MLQWSVIILLTVSMFVGRVCLVLQKDGHDDAAASAKNATAISSNNGTETSKSSVKAVEDKKETLAGIKSSSPLNNTTDGTATVPLVNANEKHNCNSTKEQVDMLNCYVTPHDSGEVTDEEAQPKTTPATNTTTASNKTEASSTESQTEKTIPRKDMGNSENKGADPDIVLLNRTENAHGTTYDVAFTEASHPMNVSDSGTDSKQRPNQAEVSISSVAPLVADNNASRQLKSSDQDRNRRMPSGMIALVTAISFAVAIAIVYVGMIVWRRYIEYRYGHRELLVNELEFDTNDLRHFEL